MEINERRASWNARNFIYEKLKVMSLMEVYKMIK
jgi:hypothetical protein